MEPYEALANAIILQAVHDYRKALRVLRKNRKSKPALDDVTEVEQFFRSRWFSTLTTLDPDILIEKLRQEVRA